MKYASRIKAITDAGIPVVAHVGLTPQSVNAFGGYKVQGKSSDQAYNLIMDCLAVQEAGAFAVTLECVPEKLAAKVTNMLHISTIGIGASSACDAQVLVNQDMLGSSSGKVAKFVKKYANLHDVIVDAFKEYKDEVVNSKFPTLEQTYKIDENDLEEAIKRIEEEK
jgi:3-methyl-2-oxobutanoate hydroxymethyltransferase